MKIQCYNCRKIFNSEDITILLDFGDNISALSGCWHIPFCKKCLNKCKKAFDSNKHNNSCKGDLEDGKN